MRKKGKWESFGKYSCIKLNFSLVGVLLVFSLRICLRVYLNIDTLN